MQNKMSEKERKISPARLILIMKEYNAFNIALKSNTNLYTYRYTLTGNQYLLICHTYQKWYRLILTKEMSKIFIPATTRAMSTEKCPLCPNCGCLLDDSPQYSFSSPVQTSDNKFYYCNNPFVLLLIQNRRKWISIFENKWGRIRLIMATLTNR